MSEKVDRILELSRKYADINIDINENAVLNEIGDIWNSLSQEEKEKLDQITNGMIIRV